MEKVSAMIFAAGLGTRLYPLTANKPKALVEIKGKTLLENAICKIRDAGISHIVVNTHHFSEQIINFLNTKDFGLKVDISDESAQLLDTAGGLKFAEPFFQNAEHILLYNVDIISDISLEKMLQTHLEHGCIASLAVRNRKTSRYLLFDKDNHLCGWRNITTGEETIVVSHDEYKQLAFSGIHIIQRRLLSVIPANQKISFTPFYLQLAHSENIYGYEHSEDQWMDLGKYEQVVALNY